MDVIRWHEMVPVAQQHKIEAGSLLVYDKLPNSVMFAVVLADHRDDHVDVFMTQHFRDGSPPCSELGRIQSWLLEIEEEGWVRIT